MRLSVYRSRTDPDTLLLDCQAEVHSFLKTRFVIPLVREASAPIPIPKINPIIEFRGQRYVVLTNLAATMPVAEMGESIGNLIDEHYTIIRAIDALLSGF